MLLRKTLSLSDVTLKMSGDVGRFSGYASKFGLIDAGGDTILRGAYAETLRANGSPKMFLEHAPFSYSAAGAASLPIGKWPVVQEDDVGLYVEGELTPGMSLSADVYAAMKHGTLDGLSVAGIVKRGDYEDKPEGGRTIKRWTKLIEISPVAFPMDGSARIDMSSVKGGSIILEAIAALDSIRDLEALLRDAGGFTKGAAAALVARTKALISQGDPAEEVALAMKALQARIERMTC